MPQVLWGNKIRQQEKYSYNGMVKRFCASFPYKCNVFIFRIQILIQSSREGLFLLNYNSCVHGLL